MSVHTPVYLDHHATTPPDPRVLDAMLPALRTHFGNPASAGHAFGWAAARLVERAREQTAALVGCAPVDVVFTSGATESVNLALRGVAARHRRPGHLVTTELEHAAVLAAVDALAASGWAVTVVGCDSGGLIDSDEVRAALREDTALVSLIAVQNEVGTIQPWREIAAVCLDHPALLHVDGAQAVGRIPVDVIGDGVDLLSLSAHKFHGPKGAGALIVRDRGGRAGPEPLFGGGGQEFGLRSGTVNTAGVVGLGEACRLAAAEMAARGEHLRRLGALLYALVAERAPEVTLLGASKPRLPGSLNLAFPGAAPERLRAGLSTLAVSRGSACGGDGDGPSRALRAMGVDDDVARTSLRICLGKDTTEEEVRYAAEILVAAAVAARG